MSVRKWATIMAALVSIGGLPAASASPVVDGELPPSWATPAATLASLSPDATLPEMARAASTAAGQDPVAQAEVDRSGRLRTGLPSEDLSGDGIGDALVLEVSFADVLQPVYDYDLVAVDGPSGEELWTVRLGSPVDALPISVGDITGDGLADVVVTTLAKSGATYGSCGSTACAQVTQDAHTWEVSVVSGADGTVAWSKAFDGHKGRAGASAALFPPGIIESKSVSLTTAASVLPTLGGDHDGDGSRDVIVQVFDVLSGVDYRFTQQAGAKTSTGAYPSFVATTAAVVSGSTGAELAKFEAPFTPGGADLSHAGDLNADGVHDLLWQTETDLRTWNSCHEAPVSYGCVGYERNTLSVEAIDGLSLAPLWSREIAAPGQVEAFVRPMSASLDAGATADLLLYDQVDVGGGDRRWWVSGYAGDSGQRLWRRETQSFPDAFDGAVLGSGEGQGASLLFVELHVRPHGEGFEVLLQRVNGQTGTGTLTTRWLFDRFEPFSIAVLGDGDGDQVSDLGLTSLSLMGPDASTSWIESGASGVVYAERSIDRRAILADAGDLDADGSADALEMDISVSPDVTESITAVGLGRATGSWSYQEPHATTFDARLGDLTGGGGNDVLISRIDAGGTQGNVALVDGETGALLWRRDSNEDPSKVATQLSFTDNSASSVQHSDELQLEVSLIDHTGAPLGGQVVRITWGAEAADVITDDGGLATARLRTSQPAGTFEATATFDGSDAYDPSSTARSIEVSREDSALTLVIEADGGRRELRGHLTDADSGLGFEGREVQFYGDGALLGSGITDASGVARYALAPRDSSVKVFEARFSGDDHLLGASASTTDTPRGPRNWTAP